MALCTNLQYNNNLLLLGLGYKDNLINNYLSLISTFWYYYGDLLTFAKQLNVNWPKCSIHSLPSRNKLAIDIQLFWRLFDRLSKSFLSQMTLIVISSFDCSVSKDTKLSGTWWLLTRLKYGWRSRAIDRIWFYWISASTCPYILFIHRVSIHLNGSLSPRECWNISLKKKILLAWFERLCLFSKQRLSVWVDIILFINICDNNNNNI